MDLLDAYENNCTRCGSCIEICPQYAGVEVIEKLIASLEWREAEIDVSHCLTCGLCEQACPNKLSLKNLIKAVRQKEIKEKGVSEAALITDPKWDRNIFKLASKVIEPLTFEEGEGDTVYFPGCYGTYLHRTMTLSAIKVLDRLGIEHWVMHGLERCCGVVAAGAGNSSVIDLNGPRIIRELKEKGTRKMITSCPGCTMAFKKVYPALFEDFNIEVFHISQVLLSYLKDGTVKLGELGPLKVFYHDPCHLTRGLGIFEEPREVLRSIPGIELVNPSPEGSTCCGFGGGVRINHPDRSIELAREKHLRLKGKVDAVITNCAGCRQNLIEGIVAGGPEVLDLCELLLRSMGESVQRDDELLINAVNRAYQQAIPWYRPPFKTGITLP